MEQSDTLFSVLSVFTPDHVSLPVLNIAKTIWQTPSSIPPTSKRTEKKYFVPAKGFEYLYIHPPPELLVVSAANKRTNGPASSIPKNEAKRLDLFGLWWRKVPQRHSAPSRWLGMRPIRLPGWSPQRWS